MSLRQLIVCSTAAIIGGGALLASVAATEATILPASLKVTPYVQRVDCAVGAHLGPLGACILGSDDSTRAAPDPRGDGGCATKSVTKTDSNGASETRTETNC